MAAPNRRPAPPLIQVLYEQPYRFRFFQAVRLLEGLKRPAASSSVGTDLAPAKEAVRFRAAHGLAFPASEITGLEPPETPGEPPVMSLAFFGLTGPQGALPLVYSELVADQVRGGHRGLAAFLDLFNHRLASFFYRAWLKHRPALIEERGETDRFVGHVLALVGLGTESVRDRFEFADTDLLPFAGTLASRHRPAIMLEAQLRDHFELPVEIESFRGRWLTLDPLDATTLGATGRHNRLGDSALVGHRVWDAQGHFRLRVGPLSFERFARLLPGGPDHGSMMQMTRFFVDAELDFEVQLILAADEVPDCRLGVSDGEGPQLGRTSWLKSRPFDRDAGDVVLPATL